MQNISLDYTFNTRDLGQLKTKEGYFIKKGRLIRSGCLTHLSPKDIEVLQSYSLKMVIDFRSQEEFYNKPDVKIEGVQYINLPALPKNNLPQKRKSDHHDSNLLQLVDKEYGGKTLLMKTYHELFLTPEGIKAYQEFFKIVLENEEGAILWHCSQGKDRAGMAAFLLEYALGVSLPDCIEDYLFTNQAMALKIKELTPIILEMSNNDESLLPILEEVFFAKLEYLNETLNVINEVYHGLDAFLTDILKVDKEILQKKYLDFNHRARKENL